MSDTTTSEETIIEESKSGFFTDGKGRLSMRRLLAFILCITAVGIAIADLWMETDWKMSLVTIGLPLLGSLLFMFFTSWESIAKVASAVKGDK